MLKLTNDREWNLIQVVVEKHKMENFYSSLRVD
jgi:hypothetical protein